MVERYDPKKYWENRLSHRFTLRGVGHISYSETYNKWLYRRKKQCLDDLFRDYNLSEKNVLDVGCGTGFFVEYYLKKDAKVFGIDITEISINNLSGKFEAEFRVSDISDINYISPKKFDIVNMWDVMYHITEPHFFNQTLINISNSMKYNGLFILTDWFGSPHDRQLSKHVVGRCLQTYQDRMLKLNFEFVELRPLYNILNRPMFSKLDNLLGRLYFQFDRYSKNVASDNLSLGVWRYVKNKN